ncbi:hypothetical protein Fmac_003529 [Flemingia macrophylla]|uniref:Uncharacterized protein n=1 Tax=Flemingia macrophylla TaxID=520843 RepID=A0ABD1NN08_9FABA
MNRNCHPLYSLPVSTPEKDLPFLQPKTSKFVLSLGRSLNPFAPMAGPSPVTPMTGSKGPPSLTPHWIIISIIRDGDSDFGVVLTSAEHDLYQLLEVAPSELPIASEQPLSISDSYEEHECWLCWGPPSLGTRFTASAPRQPHAAWLHSQVQQLRRDAANAAACARGCFP